MRQDSNTAQVGDKIKKTATKNNNITQKQQDYNERQKYHTKATRLKRKTKISQRLDKDKQNVTQGQPEEGGDV